MATIYTLEKIIELVHEAEGDDYKVLHVDERGSRKRKRRMRLEHAVCGHQYGVEIYEFLEGKRRCPRCKGKKLREHFKRDIEEVRQMVKKLGKSEYVFCSDVYLNGKTPYPFYHQQCQRQFFMTFEKFRSGQRCPHCQIRGRSSKTAKYVSDIFDHFNISYDSEKRFKGCVNPETGAQLPYDYYLPQIRTLIEIDGDHHYRPAFGNMERYKSQRRRDRIKDRFAKENGYELLRIPSDQWNDIHGILQPIISQSIQKEVTLEEIKSVKMLDEITRVNKKLIQIGKGDYCLADTYYLGTERPHRYRHTKCGEIFETTLAKLRIHPIPCPSCRKAAQERKQHERVDAQLRARTKGLYSLSSTNIGEDSKHRRMVHCHRCDHVWRTLVSNIIHDNGGCPRCADLKRYKNWEERYFLACKVLDSNKLTKEMRQWINSQITRLGKGIINDKRKIVKIRELQIRYERCRNREQNP